MTSEENLIEYLKALPIERQRELLSLVYRNLENVLSEMTITDIGNVLDKKERLESQMKVLLTEQQRLESQVETLLAERDMIRAKVEAMLEAVALLDPSMVVKLGTIDSMSRKAENRPAEKPETLFAHRGSIVVAEEQNFSSIREGVIDHHVREENR